MKELNHITLCLSDESLAALFACVEFTRGALSPEEYDGEKSPLRKAADTLYGEMQAGVVCSVLPKGSHEERREYLEASGLNALAFTAYRCGFELRRKGACSAFAKVALPQGVAR